VEIELLQNAEGAAAALRQAYPESKLVVKEIVGRMLRIAFEGEDVEITKLLKSLVQGGYPVLWCREEPLDLEHVYLKVTADAKAGARRTE
jgi:hypothetical protein